MDLVMVTKTRLYLIETKLNKDAATAMRQINIKQYAERFALYTLPRVKVGINFTVSSIRRKTGRL